MTASHTLLSGGLTAHAGGRFGIVVGRFNDFISERLLGAAIDTLRRHGVAESDITVAWAPGAFELPLVAKRLAESGRVDALISIEQAIERAGTKAGNKGADAALSALEMVNLLAAIG